MPSYISTFSIPMFSYTSLNILNILLMFLWLFFSFATSFGTSVCILLCYAFPFMNILLLPSSTMVSSFLYYILDTESSSFLVPVLFLLLYLFFYTPHTLYSFWQILHYMFFTCLSRKNPCPQFSWI